MTDIVITATNTVPKANAITQSGTAGAAITQGQAVYLDASTNLIKLANALTSLATATCVGIALTSAATNQPVIFQTGGDITLGATLTVGAVYVNSGASNGGIAPVADLTTGWYTNILGVAISTTVMTILNRGGSTLTAHS